MRLTTCLSLVAAVGLALAPAASAAPVKLVTGNAYKPFTDAELEAGGLVTKLVEAVYDEAGRDTEVAFTSWARAEKRVLDGEARATFPHVKTEPRLDKFAYSDPIFVADYVPVVRPEDAGAYTSLSAMKGGHTCLPYEWSFGLDKLDRWARTDALKVERPDAMPTCYKLLGAGRVDFIIAEAPTVPFDARAALGSADAVHREDFVATTAKLHVMFDKDGATTPSEVEHFNDALAALKESGRYDEIVDAYLDR
jgi:polar amino acid transport system substrate-binding protein